MRFHWLREKVAKNNLRIFWARGIQNYADYYTKHFPTKYHEKLRPLLFQINLVQSYIQLARVC